MPDALSHKQLACNDILWWTLPVLRNIATRPWWQRQRVRRMVRFETELIHNLPTRLLTAEFEEGDLHFLNHNARDYAEHCSARHSGLYLSQLQRLKTLFDLVPEHLRQGLTWAGPEPSHEINASAFMGPR